jgi:hypothetical protein
MTPVESNKKCEHELCKLGMYSCEKETAKLDEESDIFV